MKPIPELYYLLNGSLYADGAGLSIGSALSQDYELFITGLGILFGTIASAILSQGLLEKKVKPGERWVP